MKIKLLTRILFATFVLFSVSCSNKQNGDSESTKDSTAVKDSIVNATSKESAIPNAKKYEIKSGIVNYISEVFGVQSYQTLYFDDFGSVESNETVTIRKIMGTTVKTVSVSLTKNGYKYDYDIEVESNKDSDIKKEIKKSKYTALSSADMSHLDTTWTPEMKKQYQYKKEGTENIAGVNGSKFSMTAGKSKITVVTYKKVMLKSIMDKVTVTAQKFEENAKIPAQLFELPAGYTVVEVK